MKYVKKAFALVLILCLVSTAAFAEGENKDIFGQIGDWFSHAWEDTTKWVGQAWEDASKWVSQAWDDSSKWVAQAWKDSSEWISGNWSAFTVWLREITWDNPYTWIEKLVQEKGSAAYDRYAGIRDFLKGNPDAAAIKEKLYAVLAELSLPEEEKDKVWEIFGSWASEHHVTAEQTAVLAIPFAERLNITGAAALGTDIEINGPVVARYLVTVLDAIQVNSHEDAEARINVLKNSLEGLAKP
jgi:hypothetical protein